MCIFKIIIFRMNLRIHTYFKDLTIRLPETMSETPGIWRFLENAMQSTKAMPWMRVAEEMPRSHAVKSMTFMAGA